MCQSFTLVRLIFLFFCFHLHCFSSGASSSSVYDVLLHVVPSFVLHLLGLLSLLVFVDTFVRSGGRLVVAVIRCCGFVGVPSLLA